MTARGRRDAGLKLLRASCKLALHKKTKSRFLVRQGGPGGYNARLARGILWV